MVSRWEMAVKQGDKLASNLSNITLEHVIRHLSVMFYKSVHLTGYADNKNNMGRTKRAISEVYKELKQR